MADLDWIEQRVDKLPKNNKLYNAICFCMGRRKKKMSYKEIYMIIKNLNRSLGEDYSKQYAYYQILALYKFLNKKLPEGALDNNGRL